MDEFSKICADMYKPLNDLCDSCQYDTEFDESGTFWRQRLQKNDSGASRLALGEDAPEPYYKIMNILRKNFPDSTDVKFEQSIESLLFRILKNKKKNMKKISKDWLEDIFKKKRNMEYYTHAGFIADYPFTYSLKIDNVLIAPINSDEIKSHEFFGEINHWLKKMSKPMGMNAMFVCRVQAYDNDNCKLISNTHVNRVLHFIKLIDPYSEVRLQVKDYKVVGRSEIIGRGKGSEYSHGNILRKDNFMNRSVPVEFMNRIRDKAETFFFKKDITGFQKAILSALYWYGRVDVTFDDYIVQYISYINGLERLVLFDAKGDKAEMFGKRISCRNPGIDREEISHLYQKRNDLLHENEPNIYEDELTMLRTLLRLLILDMIDNNDDCIVLHSYFKKYDKN